MIHPDLKSRPDLKSQPHPDLLNGIRTKIRNWEAVKSKPERSCEALKCGIATEIGYFLGEQGARTLLQEVSASGNDLLSTIEPVLANFLGERAASELIDHLVDAVIVPGNL